MNIVNEWNIRLQGEDGAARVEAGDLGAEDRERGVVRVDLQIGAKKSGANQV